MINKTYEELKVEVLNILRNNYPELSVINAGNGFEDAVLNVMTHIYKVNADYIDVIFSLQFVDELINLPEQDVDNYMANFNLTRLIGNAATGVVTLFAYTWNTGVTKTVNSGDRVKGVDTEGDLIYQASDTYNFLWADRLNYYNFTENRYEFSINVEAIEVGERYNVGSYVINVFVDTFTGFQGVFNSDVTDGGAEVETNQEFVDRYNQALIGDGIGILGWYPKVVSDGGFAYDDIKVVGAGDAAMVRDCGVGGKVDVYVKAATDLIDTTQVLSSFPYNVLIPLDNQPAYEIDEVATLASVLGGSGVNIEFVYDVEYKEGANSIDEVTGVKITYTTVPTSITVYYNYNKKIVDIQDLFGDDNKIVSIDILIKSGESVGIDLGMEIRLYGGYDFDTVKTEITNEMTNYLDNLGFGQRIEQADLVYVIKGVEGVDNVNLPLSKLALEGESGVSDIQLGDYQVAFLNDINVVEF